MNAPNPPRLAEGFFRWFCHQAHLEGLEGDLYELFAERVRQQGRLKARFFYILDMVTLLRSTVAKPLKFSRTNNTTMGMISNYWKTAYRTGLKRKGFSGINIFGLTLGITSVIFILMFVTDELRYDEHITNAENKYRFFNHSYSDDGDVKEIALVPPVFASNFEENFPQIEKIGRLLYDYGGTIFTIGDQVFSEKDGVFAEESAMDILNFEIIAGAYSTESDGFSMLLSETTFKKFFGDVPFDNQVVGIGRFSVQVTGIFKDLPVRSHLDIDYIFPFKYGVRNVSEERMNSWRWQQFYTYVELKEGVSAEDILGQIRPHVEELSRPITTQIGFYYIPQLQKIRDVHLHSAGFEWDIAIRGNYQSILFLSIAAGIILLIACLNFINLTTAQALKRAKEVCVRKFVGAKRGQLLLQYGVEATMFTVLSGMISLTILVLLLPQFNNFSGKNFLMVELFTVTNISLFFLGLILLGLAAGAYPALLITSFKPIMILRGITSFKGSSGLPVKIDPRQIMVGAQYILSIGLIILSLIIQRQYNYLQNRDMGFSKENLMVIPLSSALRNDFESTRQKFSEYSNVKDVAFCYGVPGGIVAGDGAFIPDRTETEQGANMFLVDNNYLQTMEMRIVAGRGFDAERETDATEAFILNETAVRNFGLGSPEEAIGERMHWPIWGEDDSLKIGQVIGVVQDFNFKSLHNAMTSVVMHIGPRYFSSMIIRTGSGNLPETIANIEKVYREFEPTRPFDYEFVDQSFKKFYESEQKLSTLFSIFTALAIITAAIGLFGLVSFNVVSRAKEISIRKVLGAGTNTIFRILVTRYFVMVLICLAMAAPLAYYFANEWLANFAYRIDLGARIFLEVIIITIVLTVLTVGFQALKGAIANPSEKLRSE